MYFYRRLETEGKRTQSIYYSTSHGLPGRLSRLQLEMLFTEGDITPFVEMYSRHGLAESDQGDYPYLHDMGPRQWEGTIQYGLELGNKFGIMASTDQHSGYPGSYGDGRIGVMAPSLTRDAIWEALRTRHVCAATGDKIIIDFRLNDAFMGDVVRGNSRRIYLNVTGERPVSTM